jgi:hypothetical protein
VRLADGLTDALVADVAGRPGALPLLATTLRELWERRGAGGELTLDEYVASGGVYGAVARLADRAYRELPAAQRETACRVMSRLAGRGWVPRAELAGADVEALLRTLIAHHLVDADDTTVEITHEAVLAEWPRRREWLVEDTATEEAGFPAAIQKHAVRESAARRSWWLVGALVVVVAAAVAARRPRNALRRLRQDRVEPRPECPYQWQVRAVRWVARWLTKPHMVDHVPGSGSGPYRLCGACVVKAQYRSP